MSSVLIVAFDGLQPAQMTPERMPNLASLASEGVTFQNHHAVFPTVTRVNAVSMLTGRYPGGHGLAGNTMVVPEFDAHRAIPALKPQLEEVSRKIGALLLSPNLAGILGDQGMEFTAVGIGTDGNSWLHNPTADRLGGATVHPEFCLPKGLEQEVVDRFGPWPEKRRPDEERLAHAVRIMTEYVLPHRAPAVSLLWSCEPDSSQHVAGVGSSLAERAVSAADRQFGVLLEWLEKTGRASDTDVVVVSDHGYSTIKATVDVEQHVRAEGFPEGGQQGGVVVAHNGGAILFYIHEKDRATAERLADWLMGQASCGALVASRMMDDITGTLPAALVGAEGARAPDLAMSLSWDSEPNEAGFVGHVYGSGGAPGLGTHGSMSRQEMRCVLIARGPSFKRGVVLSTPSGHVDLAPTVLRIVGAAGGDAMDGRVLEEAIAGGPSPDMVEWSTEAREAERGVKGGVYRQRITTSHVGATSYVDEGSAFLGPS